jgi:small subunit ribosomal protein S4
MSKTNQPKFKIYSKLGLRLTDHPKIFLKKLGSKKWQSLYSNSKQPRKDTEYGAMLSAKQRLNLFYGQIKDKQFHTLYNNAKAYEGNQTINFIKLLERRLDVVLFRAKIAPSFREIRQLIQHGHVEVNNKVVKISSLILNKNDFFSFKATSLNFVKSKSSRYFSQIVNDNNVQAINWSLKSYNARKHNNSILFVPNYIEFNSDLMLGKLVSLPTEDNICLPMNPKLTNIMEYYKYKKKS